MDDIRRMLDRLPELSEAELGELEETIVQQFTSAEAKDLSRETVEEMTFLADSVETVRAEAAKREAEKAELAAQASEAAARVTSEGAAEAATSEAAVAEEQDPTEPPATFSAEEPAEPAEPVVADASVSEASASEDEDEDEDEEGSADELAMDAPPVAEDEDEESSGESDTDTDEVPEEDEDTEQPVFAASEDSQTVESSEAPMSKNAVETQFSAPADRLPVRPAGTPANVTLVAGGDIAGITAGSQLPDRESLAEAMASRLHALRRSTGGRGEQVVVASMLADFPEERTLRGGEQDTNSAKIKSITSPQAVVASGGWCAPLPVNYDIFDIGGSTATPVRDSLPVFNADRGGVRYITPPTLAGPTDYSAGVGIWDKDMDEAPVGTYSKPCVHVECAGEEESYLDAITMCMCFGNLQTRAFPELIAAHNELALVYAARYSEQYIMEKIKAASTPLDFGTPILGAARELLITVERAAVAYRYEHRLDPNLPLRFLAPYWLHAMIRSDITGQLPGDGLDTTFQLSDGTIDRFFAERNIRPVWSLDDNTGGSGVVTPVEYPDTVEWGLFSEGTFTLLDGGTLDIGIVRDMNLVSTNDYCMFTEQFLSVAKTGVESYWVTQQLRVSGASAGTIDISTGPDY